jgi:hypothetical protein
VVSTAKQTKDELRHLLNKKHEKLLLKYGSNLDQIHSSNFTPTANPSGGHKGGIYTKTNASGTSFQKKTESLITPLEIDFDYLNEFNINGSSTERAKFNK